MKQKSKRDSFGDLVVEASLEEIAKGARRVIGSRMKVIEGKGGVRIFSDDTDTCPLQVVATPLAEGIYRLDVGSKCTMKNCDYFGECARLDARAAKTLERVMTEILGTPLGVSETRVWTPERVKDDERLRRIIDRIIDEGP
ncbi:MAG: hypothetical protein ACFFDP_06760 [Promethearchaeota archaeon]